MAQEMWIKVFRYFLIMQRICGFARICMWDLHMQIQAVNDDLFAKQAANMTEGIVSAVNCKNSQTSWLYYRNSHASFFITELTNLNYKTSQGFPAGFYALTAVSRRAPATLRVTLHVLELWPGCWQFLHLLRILSPSLSTLLR